MNLLEALKHSSPERKFTIISKKTGFIYYRETPAAYIEKLEQYNDLKAQLSLMQAKIDKIYDVIVMIEGGNK